MTVPRDMNHGNPRAIDGAPSSDAAELLRSAEQALQKLEGILDEEGLRQFQWYELAQNGNEEVDGAAEVALHPNTEISIHFELGSKVIKATELRDVTVGSLIELESPVDEPITVLANGLPIARGELMIWNECYGVRITQILDEAGSHQHET